MTRYTTTLRDLALIAALLLPVVVPSANAAEIGPESITLEQIGAVRTLSPQEFQAQVRQHSSNATRDQSSERTSR